MTENRTMPYTRALDAIEAHPKVTTKELLRLMHGRHSRSNLRRLHVGARAAGYGQADDGTWRTAADPEIAKYTDEDRPTAATEAFMRLPKWTSFERLSDPLDESIPMEPELTEETLRSLESALAIGSEEDISTALAIAVHFLRKDI